MRIRATVAAFTGALALSAFVVPTAQAEGSATRSADLAGLRATAHSGGAATRAAAVDAGDLDITFSNVKVNNGAAIRVGTTHHVAALTTFTITHGADFDAEALDFEAYPYIYKGSFDAPDSLLWGLSQATCTPTSATTAKCSGDIDIYPMDDGELSNSDAGSWKVGVLGYDNEGMADQGDLGTAKVQRYSKLTVNASPEPVKKGKTITVTGALTRANWETHKYAGYTVQPVKLQFKKKGTTSYVTVKTVTSSSTGALKTTVKAAADGYFRYSFAGTSTTPAVSAAGDFVDVQ